MKKIPDFKSEEEERTFWSTHDSSDYMDWDKAQQVVLMDIHQIQRRLDEFATERDWGQFHTPKNLAMALSVEASELVEIFQWLTPEQSVDIMQSSEREHVEEEVADILIYLLRIADKLGVDLNAAGDRKIEINARKYTVVDEGLSS